MSYCLVGYNAQNHPSVESAIKANELFSSTSTVDAIQMRAGVYDLAEVFGVFYDLVGHTGFEFGVQDEHGTFITFQEIEAGMADEPHSDPDIIIEQIGVQKLAEWHLQKDITVKMSLSDDSYKCLGISTSHLSAADQCLLGRLAENSHMVFNRDFGWLIKLYDEHDANLALINSIHGTQTITDQLADIVKMSLAAGYRMIEVDADADATCYHGLKVYSDGDGGKEVVTVCEPVAQLTEEEKRKMAFNSVSEIRMQGFNFTQVTNHAHYGKALCDTEQCWPVIVYKDNLLSFVPWKSDEDGINVVVVEHEVPDGGSSSKRINDVTTEKLTEVVIGLLEICE